MTMRVAAPPDASTGAGVHPGSTTATILIIDDTPVNLGLVVEYLESHGIRMLVAQGGDEGLRRAILARPDLILLDAVMPRLDGFDVCRRLKGDAATRDIPVIFMTSLADTRDKLRAFEAGAVDYVVKPLQVSEVLARVSIHLSLHALHLKLAAQNAQLQQQIVERIEAERKLTQRTEQLIASNQELEAFSYSVSHDLRAPLRAICAFAEILRAEWPAAVAEDGRRRLDSIISIGARMGRLIDDLLRYARTGYAKERAAAVPLAPVIDQLLNEFAGRIAELKATIEVPERPATPLGDPMLMEQILRNLLDNALTYRSPQVPPRIRIAADQAGGDVVVTVTDNGIGIAPEYHQKIFHVFQRLHSSDEFPGTGLGLAIVAKAVRLMNGEVSVDSAPGRGSTFSVRLPASGGASSVP